MSWQLGQDWIFGRLDRAAQGFVELSGEIDLRLL